MTALPGSDKNPCLAAAPCAVQKDNHLECRVVASSGRDAVIAVAVVAVAAVVVVAVSYAVVVAPLLLPSGSPLHMHQRSSCESPRRSRSSLHH